MALLTCVDCGQSVSDQAVSCPRCGRPAARRVPVNAKPPEHVSPLVAILAIGGVIFGVWFFLGGKSGASGSTPAVAPAPAPAPAPAAKTDGVLNASYTMCGFATEDDYKASMASEAAYAAMCKSDGFIIDKGTRATVINANWTGGCEFLLLDGKFRNGRQWGPCGWLK